MFFWWLMGGKGVRYRSWGLEFGLGGSVGLYLGLSVLVGNTGPRIVLVGSACQPASGFKAGMGERQGGSPNPGIEWPIVCLS